MSQPASFIATQRPIACPGCTGTEYVTALSVQDNRVLCCPCCGLVYTWADAADDEAASLYPPEYSAHQPVTRTSGRFGSVRSLALHRYFGYPLPDDVAASSPRWLRWVAERLLSPVQGRWKSIPPFTAGGRLLDVGCGSGAYLERVRSLGWSVQGIEPDAGACSNARTALGLNVSCGTLDDIPLLEESYDVITLWHTLEHTRQPARTLRAAYSLLRPGGLIMLEAPNWGSVQRRVFGSHWFHLDLPRHRHHFHFTPLCLRHYLTTTGFSNVQVVSIPSAVGVTGSLEHILHMRQAMAGGRPWRHNRALKALFWLPEALLGRVELAGCLMAMAHKP